MICQSYGVLVVLGTLHSITSRLRLSGFGLDTLFEAVFI